MVQWNFSYKDWKHDEDVTIAVCAENYSQAMIKIEHLDIPKLDTDTLVLIEVIEPLPNISYNFSDHE